VRWNGKRGRVARRDVYVWTDDYRRSAVEARSGGAEGRSRRQECRSERDALALAERWRALGGGNWKDVSSIHQPPPRTR
jgi:hypothetical protein